MKLTGENRSTRGKTCPSVTLSITNPTWTDPGSNPVLRDERPATNRLSHGTAPQVVTVTKFILLLYYSHNVCSWTIRRCRKIQYKGGPIR
jgi:hypothetical protein